MKDEEGLDAQVKVRLTASLKEWLKQQAIDNCRTLSREIEHRLIQGRAQQERLGRQTGAE